jgi:transcriptional regulator NrdR family protein
MFNWFSVKKSKSFGLELAKIVNDHTLNDAMLNESKRLSKINYAKEKMQKRIHQFKQEEVLNFYKIATLLNTFKWQLKDAGYDEIMTNALASWVLVSLRES